MRYALPLIVPMAYLIARAADGDPPVSRSSRSPSSLLSWFVVVPQTTAFGQGSPGFAAMTGRGGQGGTMTGHAGMRRLWEWLDDGSARVRYERAPHGFEWLTLVDHWQKQPGRARAVRRESAPHGTPRPVRLAVAAAGRRASMGFPGVAAARRRQARRRDADLLRRPGWMLDRGWALSAEISGITEKEGFGPHRRPSVAWVRGRSEATTLLIGGRHLGAAGDPPRGDTDRRQRSDRRDAEESGRDSSRRRSISRAGAFRGIGYLPLQFTAKSTGAQPVRVALEQFDLQPPGVPMIGFTRGLAGAGVRPHDGQSVAVDERPRGAVGRALSGATDGDAARESRRIEDFDAAPTLRATIERPRSLGRLRPRRTFSGRSAMPAR